MKRQATPLFTLYHVVNVASGVESKKEFLGTLPVRLLIAALLGSGFYLTRSLIYGFVVHSAVDTFSYLALLLAAKNAPKGGTGVG